MDCSTRGGWREIIALHKPVTCQSMPKGCHAASAWDGCFTAVFVVVNSHVLVRLVKKLKSLC